MLLIAPVGNFTAHFVSVKLRYRYPRSLCIVTCTLLSVWIIIVSTWAPASSSLAVGVVTVCVFALCKFAISFAKVCEFHEAGEKHKRMRDGESDDDDERRELITFEEKSGPKAVKDGLVDEEFSVNAEESDPSGRGVTGQDIFRHMGFSIQLGALFGSLSLFLLTALTDIFRTG